MKCTTLFVMLLLLTKNWENRGQTGLVHPSVRQRNWGNVPSDPGSLRLELLSFRGRRCTNDVHAFPCDCRARTQKVSEICDSGRGIRDYKAFATSIAVSSWVSLPCFNASRESSIENFGTMPLFSSIRPCHVR